MICKYTFSQNFVYSCPVYTVITGSELPAYASSYQIATVTQPATGVGSYTSYLDYCDAKNQSYDLAFINALTERAATPCEYSVTVKLTGYCRPGGLEPEPGDGLADKSGGTGYATGVDPYQTYLTAFFAASGAAFAACVF